MMNKYLFTALAATSCMIGSNAVSAAVVVVPVTSNSFSYSYGAGRNQTVDFTFTLPETGTIVLTVGTDAFGRFRFNTVTFSDGTVDTYRLGAVADVFLGANTPDPITAGVENVLSVGFSTSRPGTFFGNYTFTAVPEPATWAMMLAGMGMIGLAVRRRQTERVTYA